MKRKKEAVFIATLAVIFALTLSVFLINHVKQKSLDAEETDRDTVVIKPPATSAINTEEPPEPLPHEGKTLTILGVYNEEKYLGDIDGEAPNIISQISYERNLRFCTNYRAEIVFKYTSDVFGQVYASVSSGEKAPADILNINMLSDASSFLMKGGAYNALDSGIDLSKDVYDSAFIGYFTQNGKCPFILGAANPSVYDAAEVMLVREECAILPALDELLSVGNFTLDSVAHVLRDGNTKIFLDSKALHTLMFRESLFGFDGESPYVSTDKYVEAYSDLIEYKDIFVTSREEAEIYIASYSEKKEGYKAYRLPESENGKTPVDVSRLYAFAFPANISEEDKSAVFALTDAIYSESYGIYDEEFVSRYVFDPFADDMLYCFYRIFGWGDFSDHAWDAFTSGSSPEKLGEVLIAPDTVSRQALKILYERYE